MKGNQLNDYPSSIANGIVIHREIDRYTDAHTTVAESKNRLKDKYRHYSGVIVDMFYDHFLAKNFSTYHERDLLSFTEDHYENLMGFMEHMPPKAQNMLPYMVRNNWLLGYAKIEGIHRALSGMSRRTKFDSKMDESVQELTESYELFEQEFKTFFPQIIMHVSHFNEDLINS